GVFVEDLFPFINGERRERANERMELIRAIVGKHGADELIEAMALWMELSKMPEMPFAEQSGAIAEHPQHAREVRFAIADADAARVIERPLEADADGVAARQDRGPRRAADGLGDVEIGEPHPFAGHTVEVRRLDLLGSEAADVAVT